MKKTLGQIFESAEPEELEPFFGPLKNEKPRKTGFRNSSAQDSGFGKKKARLAALKWLPAAAAACLLLAVGIAAGTGLFGKTVSGPASDGSREISAVTLTPKKQTGDRFSENLPTADYAVQEVAADRFLYSRFLFYESEGSVYAIFREGMNVYRYNKGVFTDTGVAAQERQFFTEGAYEGYTFVGGIFHCVGGNEKGLFRVTLETGKTVKYIDCGETVGSVAVRGPKIYYASYSGMGLSNDKFSLKCADMENKTVTALLRDPGYRMQDLRFEGDDLYFLSYGTGVRRLSPDMTLTFFPAKGAAGYDFDGGTLYIYCPQLDESGRQYCSVTSYDADGNAKSSVLSLLRDPDRGAREMRYYICTFVEGFTVFRGKAVFADSEGLWLQDVLTGREKKIADLPFDSDAFPYECACKTVYDGKLFFAYPDADDWNTSVILIYDGAGVKTVRLTKNRPYMQ